MNQEIKKIEEERAKLTQEIQALEDEKNQKITRLVELQGIIKYLKEKEEK